MRPLSIGSSRLMQRQSVDLPEPDGPITTTTSPALTVRSTSLSAWTSPKHLFTLSSETRSANLRNLPWWGSHLTGGRRPTTSR